MVFFVKISDVVQDTRKAFSSEEEVDDHKSTVMFQNQDEWLAKRGTSINRC